MEQETLGRRGLLRWGVFASVAGLLWPRRLEAASSSSPAAGGQPAFGPLVAGTYLLAVQHDGFPVLALALVTLTRDGGFIANDTSDQGGFPGTTKDGPVQGSWSQVGPRQIAARTLYFAFDPNGIPKWIARTTGQFEFDPNFNSGSGSLLVERFAIGEDGGVAEGADPLDPDAVPHDSLNATFTARRVTVP